MGIEGEDYGRPSQPPRGGHQPADDLGVSPVHPVEVADGNRARAKRLRNVVQVANEIQVRSFGERGNGTQDTRSEIKDKR